MLFAVFVKTESRRDAANEDLASWRHSVFIMVYFDAI